MTSSDPDLNLDISPRRVARPIRQAG